MKFVLSFLILVLLLLSGCAMQNEKPLSEDELMYEVVFREMLASKGRSLQTYCLSIPSRKDPSEALMKRLKDLRMNLKQGAYCTGPGGQPRSEVKDALSGESAARITINEIDRINEGEVVVKAGTWSSNMEAGGCTYTLKRENEKWQIIKKENCFVS